MNVVAAIRAAFAMAALASVVVLVQAEGHHWSYGKHGGPTEWGALDHAFASCQLGKLQSPTDKGYYTFDGSLTTPPCSEGVRWFVLKTPMTVAASELTAFAKLYPMNARPTQPLNGRPVEATR